jgi:hypothetical protein
VARQDDLLVDPALLRFVATPGQEARLALAPRARQRRGGARALEPRELLGRVTWATVRGRSRAIASSASPDATRCGGTSRRAASRSRSSATTRSTASSRSARRSTPFTRVYAGLVSGFCTAKTAEASRYRVSSSTSAVMSRATTSPQTFSSSAARYVTSCPRYESMRSSSGRSRQSCRCISLAMCTPSSDSSSEASPVAARPSMRAASAVSWTLPSSIPTSARRRASKATSWTIFTGPPVPSSAARPPRGSASVSTTATRPSHASCIAQMRAR